MEDVKRMKYVRNLLRNAIANEIDVPFIPIWLQKEDIEMLVRWLDIKIIFEQTYGKEGKP